MKSTNHKQLIMRNEVLEDGAPMPLASLLSQTGSNLTIHDKKIVDLWAQNLSRMNKVIAKHLPGVEIVSPPLWQGDAAKKAITRKTNAAVISMDSYDTTGAIPFRVSRHFAAGGKDQIAVGRRPGAPSLEAQLESIVTAINGKPVLLLDDDMYTGGTVGKIIQLMQDRGLSIVQFIPGVQVSRVKEVAGVPVRALEQFEPSEVLDVIDPRDFMFGLHEAGLAISDQGKLYRAPYLVPWVDLTARASIPPETAAAISLDLIELNRWFYSKLGALAGQQVSIKHTAKPFQDFVEHATNFDGSTNGSMAEFIEYVHQESAALRET